MGRRNPQKHSKQSSNRAALATTAADVPHGAAARKLPTRSMVTQEQTFERIWAPTTYTAFKALLSSRLCAAVWNNISDCDETFNYWEPAHFLMYKSGFQTWEYSPTYALRSYTYILFHTIPGSLYSYVFQPNKILVFYFIRCLLSFFCAGCEAYLYKAVNQRFGSNCARWMLVFSLFAPGMFISSAAFLPSSFSMYFTMLAIAAWILKNYPVSILCIAVSTFVGWPFAGILGCCIAYDLLLIQKQWMMFFKWCLFALLIILIPVVQIDSFYFGKLVVAPLNIVLYNVFSNRGPELYGTEPWTFYFINGFLNFNIVFVTALAAAPVLIFAKFVIPVKKEDYTSLWLTLLPLYIWMVIFTITPHKEERFLFPIYPLVYLGAAVCLSTLENVLRLSMKKVTQLFKMLQIIFIIIFVALGVSRSLALYKGYHAPFDVFMEINRIAEEPKMSSVHHHPINLCVGKEWYRFPSNFFVPPNWHLQFIASRFRGQLPNRYANTLNATAVIPDHMNDENLEELSRYIDIQNCHYLVDLDVPSDDPKEPQYSSKKDAWELIVSIKFLDATRSPSLFRSFYVPWFTEQKCTYASYNLLRAKHGKSRRHSSSLVDKDS